MDKVLAVVCGLNCISAVGSSNWFALCGWVVAVILSLRLITSKE
jgi:hypothetical protein